MLVKTEASIEQTASASKLPWMRLVYSFVSTLSSLTSWVAVTSPIVSTVVTVYACKGSDKWTLYHQDEQYQLRKLPTYNEQRNNGRGVEADSEPLGP